MELLKEVGLEIEYWLLDRAGDIKEAPMYNFPSDEMGFLIEIRSPWGRNPTYIVDSISNLIAAEADKAASLGFQMVELDNMAITPKWKFYIMQKYRHDTFEDHTQNIYGYKTTQHTGLKGLVATAGTHVHFSAWDVDEEDFYSIDKPQIIEIVKKMDKYFAESISNANRIPGEWESKGVGEDSARPHGFEYRSLPATVDKLLAVKQAIKILDEVVSG